MSIRCIADRCKAEIMGLDDLPQRSVARVYPDWANTEHGWICPAHATAVPVLSIVTSGDVERAATLAWNEAIEEAAQEAERVQGNHSAAQIRMETDIMRTAHAYAAGAASDAAALIRALKRPA